MKILISTQNVSWAKLLTILFLIAFWFLNNPYKGIYHDGIIYLGQALFHTSSGQFLQTDPFFSSGSQDRFTVFPLIYAQFINLLGVEWSTIFLLLICTFCFYFVTYLLLRAFYSEEKYICLGICCLIIFSKFYGGNQIFSFSENFLTARNSSEALCLLSLYFLVKKELLLAFIIVLLAAIFHPLMALPVIMIIWLASSINNPRLIWLAGLSLFPILLALFNIQPFDGMFKSYDPLWYSVASSFEYAYPLKWTSRDWLIIAYDIIVLTILIHYHHDYKRHVLISILAVGIGGIILSVVFADILKNVLFTGLQLWRSHWILHYFALGLTPMAFILLNQGGDAKKIAAWSLPVTLLVSNYQAGYLFLILIISILYIDKLYTITISKKIKITLLTVYGLIAVIIALIDYLNINNSLRVINDISISLAVENIIAFFSLSFSKILISIISINVLIAALIFYLLYKQKPQTILVSTLVIIIFSFGIHNWDQRQSWTKFIENSFGKNHIFSKYIPINQQVYWQQSIVPTWLLLQRPSYYSKFQFAGSLFNRETSLEYIDRTININPLEEEERACIQTSLVDILNFSKSTERCHIKQNTLKNVCLKSASLYAIILELPVKEIPYIDKWVFKTENGYEINFFLYLCDSYQ